MATNVIILNRMYAGDYLSGNIGHEVINLMKPDKGKPYYIYINQDGRINDKFFSIKGKSNEWNAQYILLTRWCKREYYDYDKEKNTKTKKTLSMVEVLAKVEGLECVLKEPITKKKKTENSDVHNTQVKSLNDVTYGGNKFEDIFKDNTHNETSIYATFSADNVVRVKSGKRIYMVDKEVPDEVVANKGEEFININSGCDKGEKINFAKTSLKQYIPKGIYNSKNLSNVYEKIESIICNDDKYWETSEDSVKTYEQLEKEGLITTNTNKNDFISIIKQEYDELTYTNLFFHIFKSNPELFCEFAKDVLKIGNLNPEKIKFRREDGNIDLLVDDELETLIVIENKIKSGINGIRHDETGTEVGNQLSKYIFYTFGKKVEKGTDKNGYTYKDFSEDERNYAEYKNRHFYIFSPKYKNFDKDKDKINDNIEKHIDAAIEGKKVGILSDKQKGSIKNSKYDVITYRDIHDFFKNKEKYYTKPKYFDEFLYAINLHSGDVDNVQERQMFERFAERIAELNKQ